MQRTMRSSSPDIKRTGFVGNELEECYKQKLVLRDPDRKYLTWNEGFIFVMGPFEGLRCTRTVVEDCIVSNISPEAIISRIRGAGQRTVYGHLRYVSGDGFEGKE